MKRYKKNKDYYSSSHLVYRCCYHVIFCPKYRYKILIDKVSDRLKEICCEVASIYDFKIEQMINGFDNFKKLHDKEILRISNNNSKLISSMGM